MLLPRPFSTQSSRCQPILNGWDLRDWMRATNSTFLRENPILRMSGFDSRCELNRTRVRRPGGGQVRHPRAAGCDAIRLGMIGAADQPAAGLRIVQEGGGAQVPPSDTKSARRSANPPSSLLPPILPCNGSAPRQAPGCNQAQSRVCWSVHWHRPGRVCSCVPIILL